MRERDQLAIALHADNMRHWSPSLVARSVAYFTLTTSWMHHVGVQKRSRRQAVEHVDARGMPMASIEHEVCVNFIEMAPSACMRKGFHLCRDA